MYSVEQMNESGCEVQRFFFPLPFLLLFPVLLPFFPVFFFKWCIAHTTYTKYMLSMYKNSWWRCLLAVKQKWVGNKHKIAVPTGSCDVSLLYTPSPTLLPHATWTPHGEFRGRDGEFHGRDGGMSKPNTSVCVVYACGVRVVRQRWISLSSLIREY